MKTHTRNSLLILPLVALGLILGCQTAPVVQPHATPKETAPVVAATTKTDAAEEKAEQKNDERDGKLRANIDHAREKNQDNPDGPPKTVVDGDLQVAQGLLADVKPDPIELAARQRDATLVESGKAAEARASYDKAAGDAVKLAGELAVAKQELDQARAAEKQAVTALLAQAEKNRVATEKLLADQKRAYDEALEKERKAFFVWIGRALVVAAIICGLIGAFSTYTTIQTGDIFKAVVRGVVWATFAAFFIACAWTINQPWFKWVIIGGAGIIVVTVAVMIRINWKDAIEKKKNIERTHEADEAESTLHRIVNVVDENFPDGHDVFTKVQMALNTNQKALLDELRAESKRAAATTTSIK